MQSADSLQQLRALSFRIYVTGRLAALTDPVCAETNTGAGYPCSGGLPPMSAGRQVLELTSVLNGTESERSAPLAIMVGSPTQAVASAAAVDTNSSAPVATSTCVVGAPQSTCYDVRPIATGLGAITAIAPTPDGRLLLVEDGARVRVIASDRLVPEAALVLPGTASQIVGLAVDSSFLSTRFVFVASTEEGQRGVPLLNITRYREVHDTLGEGATIVTALPFVEGMAAPLAVDSDGLLYVAGSGNVLRFARDGSIPRSDPRSSPVIAEGVSGPTGLALDGTGRAWLTGHDPAWPHSLATVKTDSDAALIWPRRLEPVLLAPRHGGAIPPGPMRALMPSVTRQGPWMFIDANGQLWRSSFTPGSGGLDDVEPILLKMDPLLTGTQSADGSWYLIAGDDARTSVWHLLAR